MTDMQFYVPAGSDAASASAVALDAERLGFDGVTMPDHLTMPVPLEERYPYREDGKFVFPLDASWPDPWVTMAAMATVTERVRFRSNVYLAALRHPLLTARAVATTAVISGGRVAVGVGVGWLAADYAAMGLRFEKRGAILDETIAALRTLWQPGPVSHDGDTWRFGPLYLNPIPPSPVPILVGGGSEAALRRAAHLGDGYIGIMTDTEQSFALATRVRELRRESGRAEEPFEVHIAATDARTADDYARIADHGIDGVSLPLLGATPAERRAAMEAFARDVIDPFRARLDKP